MKAFVFMTSLFLVTCLFFCACAAQTGQTNEIKELIENSNLDFKLAEDEINLDYTDKYEKQGGFGCYSLLSADGLTRYTVSGYPDCLDDYKLTGFSTYDAKYSLYDISVGGDPENAIAILEEHSYKKDEERSNSIASVFKRGKVFIQFFSENDKIQSLSIYLDVTNKENVVF